MDFNLFLKLIEMLAGSGRVSAKIYYFANHIVKYDNAILLEPVNRSIWSIADAFYMYMANGKRLIQDWSLYTKYENFRDEIIQEYKRHE